MEYQQIANLLDNRVALNASNQPSKFRTKNWVEINHESRGGCTTSSDIKFKTTILIYLLRITDAYILVKGTITINGAGDAAARRRADEGNKSVIFKNCAPFAEHISKINDTEIDNAEVIDVVMPMYNLIEYSDTYSKTSRSLWKHHKDEPNDNLVDSEPFKSKVKMTGSTRADGNTKDVKIILPLKYLRNFLRALEMPLINCEVSVF